MKHANWLVVLCCLAGSADAADPPPEATAPPPSASTGSPAAARAAVPDTPPPDYGKGFEKFHAMGLPHVGTGQYVQAFGGSMHFGGGMHRLQMKGNAFVVAQQTGGLARLVVDFARVEDVMDQRTFSRMMSRQMETGKSVRAVVQDVFAGRRVMFWQKASLSNDVAKALEFVEQDKPEEGMEEYYNRLPAAHRARAIAEYRKRKFEEGGGPLFLFAAHIHEQGFTNEANRIVRGLFAGVGDPRKVLLAAVDRIANAQYEGAYQKFNNGTNDWAAFAADLRDVLGRFPQGWQSRGAVALLASNVQARIELGVPPVKGGGLSAEDRALASRLAHEKVDAGFSSSWESRLWLLKPPATNAEDTAAIAITRRGIDGVKLLAALVDDECLTPSARGSGYYSYSSSSDREDEGSRTRRLYRHLQRPLTRGEVAQMMLEFVVPRGDGRHDDHADEAAAAEALREQAMAFHAKYAGRPKEDLLLAYFEEGNSSQKDMAMQRMLKLKDSNLVAKVEKELADEEQLDENMNALRTYVSTAPERAKPLIERLVASLEPKPAAETNRAAKAEQPDDDDNIHSPEAYRLRSLKALLKTASGSKPGDLDALLKLAAQGKSPRSTWNTLGLVARTSTREEMLAKTLAAAVAATNVESRLLLVRFCGYLKYLGSFRGSGADEEEEEAAPAAGQADKPLDIAANQAQWAELLKDGRPLLGPDEGGSVRRMAAYLIEEFYAAKPKDAEPKEDEKGDADEADDGDGGDEYEVYAGAYGFNLWAFHFVMGGGDAAYDFLVDRAKLRLAGTPDAQLPKPPAPAEVKPARRDELRKALLARPARQDLAALTLAEKLWLNEELKKNTELNGRLAPVAAEIVEVEVHPDLAPLAATFAGLARGKALDRATVGKMVDLLKEQQRAGTHLIIVAGRKPCVGGTSVSLWPTNRPLAQLSGDQSLAALYYQPGKADVAGMLTCNRLHQTCVWPIAAAADAPKKAAAKAGDVADHLIDAALQEIAADGESGEDSLEEFWRALDRVNKGDKYSAAGRLNLWLVARPERTLKDIRSAVQEFGDDI